MKEEEPAPAPRPAPVPEPAPFEEDVTPPAFEEPDDAPAESFVDDEAFDDQPDDPEGLVDFSEPVDEFDDDDALFDTDDMPDFGPEAYEYEADEPSSRSWTGWVILAFVIFGFLAATIMARDTIVEMWPDSKRLYVTIGLPITDPFEGLELRNIVLAWEAGADGENNLVVSAELMNLSGAVKKPPPVRVTFRDDDQQTLLTTSVVASPVNLIPNEIVAFKTVVNNVPAAATGAYLSLSVQQDMDAEGQPVPAAPEMMDEGMTNESGQ